MLLLRKGLSGSPFQAIFAGSHPFLLWERTTFSFNGIAKVPGSSQHRERKLINHWEAGMPMYFFHFCHGPLVIRDQIGLDLEGRAAAIGEARSAIALLLRDSADEQKFSHLQSIRIEDAFGKIIEVLPLSTEQVAPVPEARPLLKSVLRRG